MSDHSRKQMFPQDNIKTLPGCLQSKAHLKHFCHSRGDSSEKQQSPHVEHDNVT